MLLTRLARFQLAIFGVVTVICLALITTSYLHLPAAVGLGAYNVDAKFVVGGGIYQNANVTYRGVTIGRVMNVGLTDTGVTAQMRLNTDSPVPDNVTATVKSVSAIGEQYIDLVPPADPSKNMLKNGATIGVDRPRSARTSWTCSTRPSPWSAASATRACRTCSASRSRRSTDPVRNWRA